MTRSSASVGRFTARRAICSSCGLRRAPLSNSKADIDKRLARGILYEEAAKAAAGYVDQSWIRLVEQLSTATEDASRTHIAFLGTAILAKCVDPKVDVFAVKEEAGPGAYSARGLCHHVLVPNAPELDISLGVTGREPLNNQPYFRVLRVSRDMPVRSTARPIVSLLCDILDQLQSAKEAEARQALRAFIAVRRRFGQRYSARVDEDTASITPKALIRATIMFVREASEGGRRAQAVVAGLMDLFAGPARVDVRRVNDPSRSVPGDVNVHAAKGDGWERVLEVRDKAITREDLYVLVSKCATAGIAEAIMVAVAPTQTSVPIDEAQAWAAERGVSLTLFFDWVTLIRETLFWSSAPQLSGAKRVASLIEQRLIDLEASESALDRWAELVGLTSTDGEAGLGTE